MWKLFEKSKKDNSLLLSDSFVTFLKNRFFDKGFCFTKLSYDIGDDLYLVARLQICTKKERIKNEV